MYRRIGVPVDLAHDERMTKAVDSAAALARTFAAELHLVAVTSPSPNSVARNPPAFGERLDVFAREARVRTGAEFATHVRIADDPVAELRRELSAAFHDLGIDLVVVASHVPGLREYVFASRAGWLASHTDLSVFVVR